MLGQSHKCARMSRRKFKDRSFKAVLERAHYMHLYTPLCRVGTSVFYYVVAPFFGCVKCLMYSLYDYISYLVKLTKSLSFMYLS